MVRIKEIESSTQEVSFLVTVVSSISLFLGCLFFISIDGQNLPFIAGHFGQDFFRFLFEAFGYASIYISLSTFIVGHYIIRKGNHYKDVLRLYPQLIIQISTHIFALIILASLLTVFQSYYGFSAHQQLSEGAGGFIGEIVGGTLYNLFGIYGSLVLLMTSVIVAGIAAEYIHLVNILLWTGETILTFFDWVKNMIMEYAPRIYAEMQELAQRAHYQAVGLISANEAEVIGPPINFVKNMESSAPNLKKLKDKKANKEASMQELIDQMEKQIQDLEQKIEVKGQIKNSDAEDLAIGLVDDNSESKVVEAKPSLKMKNKRSKKSKAKENAKAEQEGNSEVSSEEPGSTNDDELKIGEWVGKYKKPEIGLLEKVGKIKSLSKAVVAEQCRDLEMRLESFQIKGKIIKAHVGVTLTMYEFQPDPGVKLSKITGLTSDLALLLGASSIRVLTPIPGKTTVGIEVPNKQVSPVPFADLIKKIKEDTSKNLPVALGLDVYNNPVISDISEMPHLLVSGTTGSGKSVFINTLITSLLFNKSPKDLRFLMVDPKMIELSPYNGIPHLLKPVVTDVVEAKNLLLWAEKEMDRRYQMFADTQARNIISFNEIVKGSSKKTIERRTGQKVDWKWQNMPYIVIVIDELADLMLTQGKDVEIPITRIAQKARAAGIHLVIATQRPSAEIVTGLIKTNFPTRISFKVSSSIDSRTVLDTSGAEKLLGKGDMLFMPNGKTLERVQGGFMSEKEVKKIVQAIKKK